MRTMVSPPSWGLLAEFPSAAEVLRAAQEAYAAGYRRMDAYSPFPVHGLAEAVGMNYTRLPMLILAGGITGGLTGFFMQYFAMAVHYPLVIGGKPLNSWPQFIPVTFELTILFAAFCAVFGMLAFNGLPQPYHPVFNVEKFKLASRDAFFLCIESSDPKFDPRDTRRFLQSLRATEVSDVEP
ncbi:MAG: DUF3341 domain-containing protein [Acidobacteriota bacterium]